MTSKFGCGKDLETLQTVSVNTMFEELKIKKLWEELKEDVVGKACSSAMGADDKDKGTHQKLP